MKYENALLDLIEKYEPEKVSYLTETKNIGSFSEKKERVNYEDAKELSNLSNMATKTLTTFLNVKHKIMSQVQAEILAKALTKKFGVEVTPEMLLKNVKEEE